MLFYIVYNLLCILVGVYLSKFAFKYVFPGLAVAFSGFYLAIYVFENFLVFYLTATVGMIFGVFIISSIIEYLYKRTFPDKA